ncbi:unnamed protein product [Hyaloperonospora brassicae]|uniref:Uncharacterized protein n=1 Tax=Hyaloperonospora brassicae TaxID=162125 RepID=A0AAV0U323_HYABA|nr:unnamed protein product [Hyaloperonospora brassicae]
MFRIVSRSLTHQHQLVTRSIVTSRPLFVALLSSKAPLTSLNNAAAQADLNLSGTLEELAASHFSAASAFPEFSPMEDTLLSEAVLRTKTPAPVYDAHAKAEQQLMAELQQHFCESSNFPENTLAEEEALLHSHT